MLPLPVATSADYSAARFGGSGFFADQLRLLLAKKTAPDSLRGRKSFRTCETSADPVPARTRRAVAATGLIDPIWAMLAMAVSVTAIFFNSLWGRPSLFIDAVLSVGRQNATVA